MVNGKNNEMLDAIGKQLITSASVRDTEVDALVTKDDLFAGVMKRVAKAEKVEVRTLSLRLGAAYASVSLAVAIVATLTIFSLIRSVNVPAGPSTSESNVAADRPDKAMPQPAGASQDVRQVTNRLPPENSVGSGDRRMIMADSRTYAPAPRKTSQRPLQQSPTSDEGEFYPISYGGDDTLAGGRIVRMDLPRAQAFAMGIRVPLENDLDTVRADVIVGPDGVPRAVRLVK